MVTSKHELFSSFSSGQFEPDCTGQFKPDSGGQFKPDGSGQFDRILHIDILLEKIKTKFYDRIFCDRLTK